jgi:ABC-type branched-subunit amino acid transport system substrate-binding protein
MRISLLFLFFIMALALLGSNSIANSTADSSEPTSLNGSGAVVPGGISDDKIVLGISAAFTGSSAGLGIENYRGAMAYFEEVNAKGGVNGRQIVLRAYDDGYNPIPAIDNTIALVEQDEVFLLFGYVGTPTVTRVLPLLQRYKEESIYLFFPFTGAQPQREAPYDQFVFNLRASYRQETAGLVDNFVNINRKRIAVFYQADAYGRSGWDGVRRALAAHELKMVGEATYRRGSSFTQEYKAQVERLRAQNAEAVILVGSYEACAGFIRDARDAGWDVPLANLSFVGSESLLSLLLKAGEANSRDYTTNLINSQVVPSYEDTILPAVREYRQLMDKHQPTAPAALLEGDYEPLPYSFVSFEGFLNAKLMVELLTQLGESPQREDILGIMQSFKQIDLGIKIPISFGEQKHQGLEQIYYMWVVNKRFVPIRDWQGWAR